VLNDVGQQQGAEWVAPFEVREELVRTVCLQSAITAYLHGLRIKVHTHHVLRREVQNTANTTAYFQRTSRQNPSDMDAIRIGEPQLLFPWLALKSN
jgi:hypothetical protein